MQPVLVSHPVPAPSSEQRTSERFGVGLPYTVDGRQGHTSDLSATGLAFESDTCYVIGEVVTMTVRYALDGHNVALPCEMEVVRVKPHGDHFMIGARLIHPFFEPEG